ncbi:hypothetical protein PBI_CANTARE_67 [Brevibacterium phage Cantare]|uniref:Uncharacterized protein n=1 Tax=Brevibacterium phage Cantare TaxID=2338395 RepID=A0A3G3LZ51_9CAUD|nr:hypothetical protein PQD70_gp067 [Brevibacterium phage Cantare]AYQ99287.1 hypothetical protein PBI_CANTARE_67 [Brevibacterium phage Cantare]
MSTPYNPYTVVVRLSELIDIIERFDPETKANHIHIQGSYIYFAQGDDREDFSIAKSIQLADGSAKTGSFMFEYDIKRLARWVKDATKLRASLFSPLSMMVHIVIQGTRVRFELKDYELTPLEMTYRDASAIGAYRALHLSFISTPAIPLNTGGSVSVPMHLILPYSTYKKNVRKPMPLAIFGYEGYTDRIGFTFDGLIGTYGTRG